MRRFSFPRSAPWFQWLTLGPSGLLLLIAAFAYWFQPDSWAAVLVFPRWTWLLVGFPLASIAFTRKRKIAAAVVGTLWLVYALIFVDELSSLTRWRKWQVPREHGAAIRVVSLNAEGGNEDAAAEVVVHTPDIVLFQESPVRPKLEALREKLVGADGELYSRPDVSILARGKIIPQAVAAPFDIPFSHARVELASGATIEVIGVRLHPYDIMIDLWSPECWRKQKENRQKQRRQIEWLVERIESIPRDVPLIVGGDFNSPGRDSLLNVLKTRLHDAYREAGSGLVNTLANNIPVLRIDHVWVSDHFKTASLVARRTIHSDHRMVICDLIQQ